MKVTVPLVGYLDSTGQSCSLMTLPLFTLYLGHILPILFHKVMLYDFKNSVPSVQLQLFPPMRYILCAAEILVSFLPFLSY